MEATERTGDEAVKVWLASGVIRKLEAEALVNGESIADLIEREKAAARRLIQLGMK